MSVCVGTKATPSHVMQHDVLSKLVRTQLQKQPHTMLAWQAMAERYHELHTARATNSGGETPATEYITQTSPPPIVTSTTNATTMFPAMFPAMPPFYVLVMTAIGLQYGSNRIAELSAQDVEPTTLEWVAAFMPTISWTKEAAPDDASMWLWWSIESHVKVALTGLIYAAGQIAISLGKFGFTTVYQSLWWFFWHNSLAIVKFVIIGDLCCLFDMILRQYIYPEWFHKSILFFVEKPSAKNSNRTGYLRRFAVLIDDPGAFSEWMKDSVIFRSVAPQFAGWSLDSLMGFVGWGVWVGDFLSFFTLLPGIALMLLTFNPVIYLLGGGTTAYEMFVSLYPSGTLDYYFHGNTYMCDIILRVCDRSPYTSLWVHIFQRLWPLMTSGLRMLTRIWESTLWPLMTRGLRMLTRIWGYTRYLLKVHFCSQPAYRSFPGRGG